VLAGGGAAQDHELLVLGRGHLLDGQHRVHAGSAGRQPDRRPVRGVRGGIVEQVAEDAADGQRVDPDQQPASDLDGDRMVGVGKPRGLAGLLREGGGIHQRPPHQTGSATIRASGDQQLVEEPLQLLALPACHPKQLLLLAGRQCLVAVLEGRQGAKQRGQRPPQLMRDHGQQLVGVVAR
jgi:hypothetical protein